MHCLKMTSWFYVVYRFKLEICFILNIYLYTSIQGSIMSTNALMGEAIRVKLYALNVRGLADGIKGRCVFNWMRDLSFEIFFL